jgi:trigger factor
MDISTEQLETHELKVTVELPTENVEKAMKSAARRISNKYRIPGFRKGKAPYWRILKAFGAEAVFEEALEDLSQDVYKKALDEIEVDPYGPGALVDVQQDPVRLVYQIPLQPSVELGDYRAVRLPFEEPEVTDEQLDEAMRELRESRVVTETVERAADWGDQVNLDIFGVRLQEGQETLDEDEEVEQENILIDQEGDEDPLEFILDAENDLLPGFAAEVVGLEAGSEKEFTLDLPEDYENEELAGRRVFFEVEVIEVLSRSLPELNDTFAADVTNGEHETLLEMRVEVRKQLKQVAVRQAEEPYIEEIFDKLIEDSTIAYPPVMVDDAVEDELRQFDARLRRQGLTLDDYLRIRQTTREEVGEDFRESAEENLKRSLILGKVVETEEISIEDEALQDEIRQAFSLGEGFDTEKLGPQLLGSFRHSLLTQHGIERLVAIAKGEEPAKGPKPQPEKKEKVTSEHVATLDDLRDEMEEKEGRKPKGERVEGGIVRID